jgi:predicted nuclease with TOPRIM domain
MRLNFNSVINENEVTITEKNQQLQNEINKLIDEVIDLKDKNRELESELNVWINNG